MKRTQIGWIAASVVVCVLCLLKVRDLEERKNWVHEATSTRFMIEVEIGPAISYLLERRVNPSFCPINTADAYARLFRLRDDRDCSFLGSLVMEALDGLRNEPDYAQRETLINLERRVNLLRDGAKSVVDCFVIESPASLLDAEINKYKNLQNCLKAEQDN